MTARSHRYFQFQAQQKEAAARQSVAALGAVWLYERQRALEADLAEEGWTAGQRKSLVAALKWVNAAIRRRVGA